MLHILDVALRIATAVWPLLTESLALAFWSSGLTPLASFQAAMVIGSLCVLVFAPPAGVFVRVGAAIVLVVHTGWSLVAQGASHSDVQTGTLVNAGFAAIWLAYLGLRVRRGRGAAAAP